MRSLSLLSTTSRAASTMLLMATSLLMPWPFRVLLAVVVLTFSVAAGLALYEYLRS